MRRILFYCHNVYGLGHIVRGVRVAEACAALGARCRLLTGCRRLDAVPIDPAIEITRLPPVEIAGGGEIREIGGADGTDVMQRRTRRIAETCAAWEPDVLVVDYTATGLAGELIPVLGSDAKWLERCRVVWGVPYAKASSTAKRPPGNPMIRKVMNRYDAAIAYTDPAWDDPFTILEPAGLPPRRWHAGFVTAAPVRAPEHPGTIVALSGGGWEAAAMLERLLAALAPMLRTGTAALRFVTGPLGDAQGACGRVREVPNCEIVPEMAAEEAVADASVVVSRCGYNSAYTLMRSNVPAVLLPLVTPCREQLDRAEKLARLERVWLVREDAPDDGCGQLREAVMTALRETTRTPRALPFSVDGARRAAEILTGPEVQTTVRND